MMFQATWETANKSAIDNILKTTTHSLKNMEKNYKKIVTDEKEIANNFNEYFATMAKKMITKHQNQNRKKQLTFKKLKLRTTFMLIILIGLARFMFPKEIDNSAVSSRSVLRSHQSTMNAALPSKWKETCQPSRRWREKGHFQQHFQSHLVYSLSRNSYPSFIYHSRVADVLLTHCG